MSGEAKKLHVKFPGNNSEQVIPVGSPTSTAELLRALKLEPEKHWIEYPAGKRMLDPSEDVSRLPESEPLVEVTPKISVGS